MKRKVPAEVKKYLGKTIYELWDTWSVDGTRAEVEPMKVKRVCIEYPGAKLCLFYGNSNDDCVYLTKRFARDIFFSRKKALAECERRNVKRSKQP